MTTINQEGNKLNPDTYVELYTFDCTTISAGLITASTTGTTLTVTSVPTYLTLSAGMLLSYFGMIAGTSIVSQVSGTTGGIGVYTINNSQTITSADFSISSSLVLYFCNVGLGGDSTNINLLWQGNQYLPLPFEMTGVGSTGNGSSLPRPSIAISNVKKTLMFPLLTMGDLVGMKVTRCRTFYKFTDNGSEPNSLTHYPLEVFFVNKKSVHNKTMLQFELTSSLDREGLKLPRRQILRDGDGRIDSAFPGVSRVRIR